MKEAEKKGLAKLVIKGRPGVIDKASANKLFLTMARALKRTPPPTAAAGAKKKGRTQHTNPETLYEIVHREKGVMHTGPLQDCNHFLAELTIDLRRLGYLRSKPQ